MSKMGDEYIKRLETNAPKLLDALKEIAKGKGRYSVDRLTHAENTIEDMINEANDAIALIEVINGELNEYEEPREPLLGYHGDTEDL